MRCNERMNEMHSQLYLSGDVFSLHMITDFRLLLSVKKKFMLTENYMIFYNSVINISNEKYIPINCWFGTENE